MQIIIEEFTDFNKIPSKNFVLKCAEFCINVDKKHELLSAGTINSELYNSWIEKE